MLHTSPLAEQDKPHRSPGRSPENSQRGTEGGGSEAETEFLLEGVPVLQSLLLL